MWWGWGGAVVREGKQGQSGVVSCVYVFDKVGRQQQQVHQEFTLLLESNIPNLFLFVLVVFLVCSSASVAADPPHYHQVSSYA